MRVARTDMNQCLYTTALFPYEKTLASLLRKAMNDGDKDVRSSCRGLFLAFANVWPQLAHKYVWALSNIVI